MQCRFCNYESLKVFLDLNTSALSNAYLSCEELSKGETWYPLKLFVCENCWLVQSQDFVTGKEIFVKENEAVIANQKISESGYTETKNQHLYFEIRKRGKPVDPLAYLPKLK